MKKCLFLLLLCACLCLCLACSGGIDKDDANAFIGEFFLLVTAQDFETATTYLHPDCAYADLAAYFAEVGEEEEIDFANEIKVEKRTGFSSAYYDSTVAGSIYEPTFKTTVGEKTVIFTIEIVQNESGYGIYNLWIDTE